MKNLNKCLIIICGIIFSTTGLSPAQNWTHHEIETGLWSSQVKSGDIDQDGDNDILLLKEDQLFWKENPGWESHYIGDLFPIAVDCWLDLFDMDGDGDLDALLSSNYNPSRMCWYENNKNGYLWTEHIICNSLNGPKNMPFSRGDIDKDGDIDLVVPNYGNGNIEWLENPSSGSLWEQHVVANMDFVLWSTVADMDKDGDPDIVAGNSIPGSIHWYENESNQVSWTKHEIGILVGNQLGYCADVDNDGDKDIISSSVMSNELVFFKNPSWEKVTVLSELNYPVVGVIAGIDGDDDLDIPFGNLAGSQGSIAWAENNGSTKHWSINIVEGPSNMGKYVTDIADINGDGSMDIISSSIDNNTLTGQAYWHSPKNFSFGNTILKDSQHEDELKVLISPHPVVHFATIEFSLLQSERVDIKIVDLSGKQATTLTSQTFPAGLNQFGWNADNFTGGYYIVQINSGSFHKTSKIYIQK